MKAFPQTRDIAPPFEADVGRELFELEAKIARENCDEWCCGGIGGCVHEGAWLRFGASYEDLVERKQLACELLAMLPWWQIRRRREQRQIVRWVDAADTQLHGLEYVYG